MTEDAEEVDAATRHGIDSAFLFDPVVAPQAPMMQPVSTVPTADMEGTTTSRRRAGESFRIHEDVPSTEDTEMNEEMQDEHEEDDYDGEPALDDNDESVESDSSEDDSVVDNNTLQDIEKIQNTFPALRHHYRLIKRIGEGWSFSWQGLSQKRVGFIAD